jgi:outer membrane protein OmpA-like peptidoglycan-associated protein
MGFATSQQGVAESEPLRMKAFWALVLVLCSPLLRAQPNDSGPTAAYPDAKGRFTLSYPRTWQLRREAADADAAFYAPATGQPVPAVVTLTVRLLPDAQKDRRLTSATSQDSLRRLIEQLPKAQIVRLDQQDLGRYEELRYEYAYTPAPGQNRTHVAGRRIWRAGYEFLLEYQAETNQDNRFLAEGRQIIDSFAFTDKSIPSRRYADQVCDGKLYGIAAMSRRSGQWEDDCRTIHEFPGSDLTREPIVHRQVLPFQSYALAKGFDNCLYSVTKAPTDQPELVYRYDPTTRKGAYTPWRLPAQGEGNVWISAATDERGDLYFLTSDANQLVRVSPREGGTVTVVWRTDPAQQASFYPAIAFAGAGTHGNFCLDDANTMYLVYSTDGSLLKVDLKSLRPSPDLLPLTGLPQRGGYSDLLMQNDEAGRRRLYLAGPHAIYKVDLARHLATRVRRGTYTDLAGCNLFQVVRRTLTPPPPPATATWRGRILSAATLLPLPDAQLRFESSEAATAVILNRQGAFSYTTKPGRRFAVRTQLAGYLPADTAWTAAPGAAVADILLRPLALGVTLPLNNVQFAQGQAVLLPTSALALDQLARLMAENPRMTIELRGHTDNVGPPEKNVVLSQQRVATVKAYLVDHGIAATRIVGIGFGGAQPAASNDEEATRKLNRRVEFRVTGI